MMLLSGGYYITELKPGLQLIMLNTNMYFTLDKLTAGEKDPAGQLQWLESVLVKTRESHEKVKSRICLISSKICRNIHNISTIKIDPVLKRH